MKILKTNSHKSYFSSMQFSDIPKHRLLNQKIAESNLSSPEEVVSYMAAMQAQEYAMAKWAIGLRLPNSKDATIEEAFNKGEILRTHILRPTWHFVAPKDIRWILKISAPRVHAINAFMMRKMELDTQIYHRSNDIITKALEGNKQLTRTELNQELQRNKIKSNGISLSLLMMHAELEGLICSSARKGKQFTYALLDERIPETKTLTEDEALAELTQRYFRSRGPATLQDFVTWSGLTVTSARKGLNSVKENFNFEILNEKEYIFHQQELKVLDKLQTSFLMPDYDEYGIGYKDRSAILEPKVEKPINPRDNPIFNRMIVVDGKIIGSWYRTITGDKLVIETRPFNGFSKTDKIKIKQAAEHFAHFLGISDQNLILSNLY